MNTNYNSPFKLTYPKGNYSKQEYSVYQSSFFDYDENIDPMDKDYEFIKRMYSNVLRTIQTEVDEECDKLEYEGSAMFNEYLDKVQINFLIDLIYDKVSHLDYDSKDADDVVMEQIRSYNPSCHNCNWLRNLVEIMVFTEMLNRRNRYRRHRGWY